VTEPGKTVTDHRSRRQLHDVAALLSSLDQETAVALLSRLPSDLQQQLRAAVSHHGEFSVERQRALSEEMCHALRQQNGLEPDLAAESESPEQRSDEAQEAPLDECVSGPAPVSQPAGSLSPGGTSLGGSSLDQLARLLQKEHPQTVAAVLSTLVPHRAARLMLAFSPGKQYETVRRIAEMERTDMESLVEVERELREQIEREDNRSRPANDGWQAVQSILMSVDTTARQDIIDNLERFDTKLASRLGGCGEPAGDGELSSVESHYLTAVAFDRLADLDAVILENVFRMIPHQTALNALAGASHGCLKDLMHRLPDDMTQRLQLDLAAIGPLRLRDIHQAQAMLVQTARRVADASALRERDRLRLSA